MTTVAEALTIAFDSHRAGDLDRAEAIYRQILDVAPDHVDALHLLGLVARRTGRHGMAAELIRRAVALDPSFAEAQYNLGNALMALGRHVEAVAPYRDALAVNPDHPGARRGLERALGRIDPLDELAITLDGEYRDGRWSYLSALFEVARYGVVAGYVNRLAHGARLLDLGCGEGNLFPFLSPGAVTAYVGVDISEAALEKSKAQGEKVRLVCSPLETFTPAGDERFDVILFNEVLVYIEDPIAMIQRYRSWLADGGVMVVSYYKEPGEAGAPAILKEKGFWTALDHGDWQTLDEVSLHNHTRNLRWRIRLLRPQVVPVT
ncbi:MAG TPA: methyltransferase domain-containing protein [Azospirillaceae bacterium]|nr:methyltransferase domain-containing protein [Azospirillaceae bacterium]